MHIYNAETDEFEPMNAKEIVKIAMGKHPCVKPGETKAELYRLGAPLDEIVSGEDENEGGEAA